ncbi:MAG: phosphonate metabolism protein PhnM [Cellulosilyticaceae bacterium]
MYLITNGKVVTEKGILEGYEVLVEDDIIKGVEPSGTYRLKEEMLCIDAEGGYIAPGFVDIHSDYIETIASPRPTSMMPFEMSLREAERNLVGEGITTIFHSLSFYKKDEFGHKPIREVQNVRRLLDAIHQMSEKKHLMRHKFHARFEIDNLDEVDYLRTYLEEGKVQLLSFMDHTPGQGQYRDLALYREALKGYVDITDAGVDEVIDENQQKEKMSLEMIREMTNLAKAYGVSVASHDDDTCEKVGLVKSFGATISEFPITLETAQYAKEAGMYTVAGAPNILLGGSHSGNLSAAQAIQADAIDVLCSDYYPPAMLHAVFKMHKVYGMDLGQMFNLVTINPARAVHLDHVLGSIEVGKKADILVIEKHAQALPVIRYTMVDGHVVSHFDYRDGKEV